jgi:undecaprenyl-diphosphatase
LSFLEALLLGIVEGLSEFLPISSTGHLLLFQRVLEIPEGEAADAWAICVQSGAILAVLTLFPARCASIWRGALGKDDEGRALLLRLMVAFVPVAVLGLLFKDTIEEHLLGLRSISWAWLIGGLLILALGKRLHPSAGGARLETLSLSGALGIGLLQCAGLLPGTSRSLATILGGVLVGLSVAAAIEFSFLLGLAVLLAASLYKFYDAYDALFASYSVGAMITGVLAAYVSAAFAMRGLLAWVRARGLAAFGWYRVALGVAVLVWLENAA